MSRVSMVSLFLSLLLLPAAPALAGAYGQPEEPPEMPVAAPPPARHTPTPPPPAPTPPTPRADFADPGFYFEGGATYGIENFDFGGVDDAWGYEARAGYRLDSMWAVEAEWEQYFDFGDAPGFDVDMWLLTANARFYPTTGRIQPYLLAGAGYGRTDVAYAGVGSDEDGDAVLRFGLGADAYVTDNAGFTFEGGYVLPLGEIDDFDLVPFSAGFFYRFT